jgi:hypothetical protein
MKVCAHASSTAGPLRNSSRLDGILMELTISLPFDPYRCFMKSTSPAGLYARQKWMGKEGDGCWRADFDECTASLLHGQLQNGSWDSSFVRTVQHLFGLHLTIRHPTKETERALDWLLDQVEGPHENSILSDSDLNGLPFVTGDPYPLNLAMTLFLSTIFGHAGDPRIVARYRELSYRALRGPEGWGDPSDMSNILRAFVVHPLYAKDPATVHAVEELSRMQHNSGMWPEGISFCQAVNALAHLDLPTADRQLKRAFMLLAQTQNEDGTWGAADKEWNTFLAVHALRNKKILLSRES